MNARVRKKKKNYYIELEWTEKGKRKTKSISVRKRLGLDRPAMAREANALRDKIMHEHRQGTHILPSTTPFKEFILEWVENHKHNIKQTTYESYLYFIENHIIPELDNHTLHSLRPSHLKALYTKKLKEGRADGKPGGLSTRSVKYIHTIISAALDGAFEDELVSRNVAKSVTPPTVKTPQIKYWAWDKARYFLEETKQDRYYLFYLIALSTGMARGELLGQRWQDVNWNKQTLTIRQTVVATKKGILVQDSAKTKSRERTLDISTELLECLRAHRVKQAAEIMALENKSHPGFIFTASTGNILGPRTIDEAFVRAIKRINNKVEKEQKIKEYLAPLTLHGLRHTYATHLLEEGVHPKVVQERLGHSSIKITLDTYSHVHPRLRKEVASLTNDLI